MCLGLSRFLSSGLNVRLVLFEPCRRLVFQDPVESVVLLCVVVKLCSCLSCQIASQPAGSWNNSHTEA